MRFRFYILTAVLGTATLSTPVVAHPLSFVDAWIKAADVVDVRLNIFLEDALRYQLPAADLTKPMSAGRAADAVESYSATLLKQIRIIDESGIPLVAELLKSPDWKPRRSSITPADESLLKLTWHVRFRPAKNQSPTALCFLHGFSGQTVDLPGELRIHLQHIPSGRRIDAVVPEGIPHTMLLPSAKAADGQAPDIQQAHSRIVVGALDIVHEFSAPVAILDAVMPEATDYRRQQLESPDSLRLTAPQMTRAETALTEWMSRNAPLQVNGQQMQSMGTEVSWFSPGEDLLADTPVEKKPSVPFAGTRLAIRLTYRPAIRPHSLSLTFLSTPGTFTELTTEIVSAAEQTSRQLSFVDNATGDVVPLQINWARSAPPATADAGGPLQPVDPLMTPHDHRPGKTGLIIAAVFLLVGAIGAARATSRSVRGAVLVAALSFAAVAIRQAPDVEYRVDELQATRQIGQLLARIYHEATTVDESQAVAQLSEVLSADLTESVFLATQQSLRSNAAEPLLISIKDVSVEEFVPSATATTRQQFTGTVTWRVTGQVHHWGHIHTRAMIQGADLVLRRDGEQWKIESIVQTGAPRMETLEPAGSDS